MSNISGQSTLAIGAIRADNGSEPWDGTISEFIIYDEISSSQERQRVESYLALKYGITLSSTDNDGSITEGDYLLSGGTKAWDFSTSSAHHNNVAGIVRDDNSILDQRQSRSVNSDAIVTMGLDDEVNGLETTNIANANTFSADQSALIWGHDGEELYDRDENIDFNSLQVNSRLNREWRVRETGTVGTVTIQFDVSNLEGPTGTNTNDESQIVLLVDADGDFSSGASIVSQSLVTASDGLVNFRVDFTDGLFFTLGSAEQNALPITLIDFTAKPFSTYIDLEWITSSEVNNSLFRIERSSDGIHFKTIGFHDGAGTTQNTIRYNFKDHHPANGNNYYRLIDIDHQGNEHYSELVMAPFQTENTLKPPYPNSLRSGASLYFTLYDGSSIQKISLFDFSGNSIPVEVSSTKNKLRIQTGNIAQGVYLLRLKISGNIYSYKIKVEQ